ncbi:hypothetical protein LV89_04837 [Arcicella aurantiaca]|uniref:DUF3945 domain-containing protein n=1 Tax=Arcicella aurantiaca TaxID=591202 RepID=A0A316DEN9_9BACT|nr:hypothetical protein [Arcicella aurantiaca]PWK16671.1 hypothetical protein LV89_04837 [Arcicella aurantiaca]
MSTNHENLDNSTQEVDSRIVENLSPSLIIAPTDEIIIEALKAKSNVMIGVVSENVQEHQLSIAENKRQKIDILTDNSTSNDWLANFTNVAMDNSMEAVKGDLMALSILSNRNYSEQLLQGKSIIYQGVQTDAAGKPKAFMGLKMLQLTRDIKNNTPVLTLNTPQRYDFRANDNELTPQKRLTATLHFDVTNEIVDKLAKSFGVKKDFSHDKDFETLFLLSDKEGQSQVLHKLSDKEAFIAMNAIQRIGHKHLLNDNQRREFYQELEKDGFVGFSHEVSTKVGKDIFLESKTFPMENVPTKYKGVKLTPLQSFQLAKGNSVSIEGIKDDKVEGIYTANVKLDVFNGKNIEHDRKVSTEKLDKSIGMNAVVEKVVNKETTITQPKLNLGM